MPVRSPRARRPRRGLAPAAVVLTLAIGGGLSACGDDERAAEPEIRDRPAEAPATSSTTTAPPGEDGRIVRLELAGGRPVDGVRTVDVELGEKLVLVVESDTADELHLHGYDLTVELEPGEEAVLAFTADKPGVWEAELHGTHTTVLELRVR